jgi:hypothetical protein
LSVDEQYYFEQLAVGDQLDIHHARLGGEILQAKALRNEPRSLGQARPITKHVIAVQTPTNVKMASLDQDFVEGALDVGSLGLVGSTVGSVKIGWMRILNDRSQRENMIGMSGLMKQQS